jgi:four helix bundle protein
MAFKFEKLEVWQVALEYLDLIYKLSEKLPRSEEYNLKVQIIRAATSISLNIAEGSTSQSNAEQGRFLGMAIRSLIETVACLNLIQNRNYFEKAVILEIRDFSEKLFAKLQAFRNSLK